MQGRVVSIRWTETGSARVLYASRTTPTNFRINWVGIMKCKAETTRGPCENPVKPGSAYCRQHSRDANLSTAYRLSNPELQDAVQFHAKASLLDISEQIVLLRSIVERRLNMAGDSEADQISAFNFVAIQLQALTKMTESLVKLGKESGDLMPKTEVETYVDSVLEIVIDELQKTPGFEPVVDKIVSRISSLESGDAE